MAAKRLISKISSDEYKKLANFAITYGTAETKFGNCLLALNDDKVCYVSFFETEKPSLGDLTKTFPNVNLQENNEAIKPFVDKMFDEDENKNINLLIKGTDFETTVWQELVNLKKGSTSSYEDIAKAIGKPKAIRAVASAIAKNNIAYLVPCHRVIQKSGGISKYRWGADRKLRLLKFEQAAI